LFLEVSQKEQAASGTRSRLNPVTSKNIQVPFKKGEFLEEWDSTKLPHRWSAVTSALFFLRLKRLAERGIERW